MSRSNFRVVVALLGVVLTLPGCKRSSSSGSTIPGPPQLSQVDPAHGPAGASVTLRGQNFETDDRLNAIFFGSVQAPARSSRTTEVVCDVPGGVSVGDVPVTISTRGGTSSGVTFHVDPQGVGAPTIASLSPQSGAVGTRVVITGAGFSTTASQNTITFNSIAAAAVTATATRLEADVPAGATTGPVVVRTSAGISNGITFTVTSNTPTSQGASGSRAREYLTASPYTSMLVEVDYIQGNAPDQDALNLLRTRLGERCNKPGGFTIVVSDQIPDPGITTWRLADIQRVEQQYRNNYSSGNTAVLYFLYVNGGSEWDNGSSKVLGVSHTGSSICMFKDNMRGSVTTLLTGSVIEKAVIVHETGHNLGLVHNGISMVAPHEDSSHPAHDSSSDCVMYWAVETSLISQLLGTIPNQYDSHCLDDLRAAGGK